MMKKLAPKNGKLEYTIFSQVGLSLIVFSALTKRFDQFNANSREVAAGRLSFLL
jgi:hypothetical protein